MLVLLPSGRSLGHPLLVLVPLSIIVMCSPRDTNTPSEVARSRSVRSVDMSPSTSEISIASRSTLRTVRYAGNDHWSIPQLYCRECHPDEFTTMTLGATELLIDGILVTTTDGRDRRPGLRCMTSH